MHILAVVLVDAGMLWMDFHGVAKYTRLTQSYSKFDIFDPKTWSCKKISEKPAFQNSVTHELSHFGC